VQQSGSGSNPTAIHRADRFLGLLIDYAGIANCPFFDFASFDLFGERRTVRAGRVCTNAGTAPASFAINTYRYAFHQCHLYR
jgi:hypothetical protein